MRVVIVVHGRGEMVTAKGVEPVAAGDTLLLPAGMGGETWFHPRGAMGMLVAALPERASAAGRKVTCGAA